MFQVRDWLYISGHSSAISEETLEAHGIEAMLQLYECFDVANIITRYIPLQDGFAILPDEINRAVAFVKAQHEQDHTVLVTCGMGVSRSVTISIAALVAIEGITMESAYRSIRKHHSHAMPDHLHWRSVAQYFGDDPDFWRIWGDIMLDEADA